MVANVVKTIRVILGNLNRPLCDSIRPLIGLPGDIEVVSEIVDPLEILMAVRELGVDAVLVASAVDGAGGLSSHLLAEYPDLTVISVLPTSDRAYIEQRLPHRWSVGDPWSRNLVDALRRAIHASQETRTD